MAITLQSQAIDVANDLMSIAQALVGLKQRIDQRSSEFTQLTLGTVFANLATAAVGADGSLGAADLLPNVAHVIDPRVVTTISRAISSNDLASLNTLLQAISTLLTGSAVTQQGQSPQLLAKLI